MKTNFSKMLILLVASSLVAPAHIFAQSQPTQDPDAIRAATLSKVTQVSQRLMQSGMQFSLTSHTDAKHQLSPEELSTQIASGKLSRFYALLPFDPSIHAKLGTKFEIVSRSDSGLSIRTEVMHENTETKELESFETPVKKLIAIDFKTSTAISVELAVDQASKSAYRLAKKQTLDSMSALDKARDTASTLAESFFMPKANAELLSDMLSNLFYLAILGLTFSSAAVVVVHIAQVTAEKGKVLNKKFVLIWGAVFVIAGALTAFIAAEKNSNTYGNDGN